MPTKSHPRNTRSLPPAAPRHRHRHRPLTPLATSIAAGFALVLIPASKAAEPVSPAPNPSPAPAPSTSGGTVELQRIRVLGAPEPVETEVAKAEEKLAAVPGGTNLIKAEDFEKGRASSTADALALQPGVYAQSAGGNDAIKLSIRGSSINRGTGFFRSGVTIFYDQLPVTGPGGTPFELFEPLGLSRIEILRGNNAFDYGGVALGGAINYVTNTGFEASPLELRAEGGSFGYAKGQIASGYVSGPLDYFVSVTSSHRDGYQDHSNSETFRVAANIGYQINPDLHTRFYFRYGYTRFQQPGLLTRAQLEADPSQANPTNVIQGARRLQPGSTWIANKTTLRIDDASNFEIGAVYHDYPIEIGGPILSDWWFGDVTGSLRYNRTDTIFGKENKFTLAALSTVHIYAGVRAYDNIGTSPTFKDFQKDANYDGSADTVILASDELQVLSNLWLSAGASLVGIRRESDITYPVDDYYDREDYYFVPRGGFRYEPTPDIQIFGSAGRTVEPPNSWSFSGGSSNTQFFNRDLRDQKAVSVEGGVRAKWGIFQGSATYYRSWIEDELLSVEVSPGIRVESNASSTIHQGVEVGLDTILWQKEQAVAHDAKAVVDKDKKTLVTEEEAPKHQLVLRQAYTWSDFFYEGDPVFGRNQLAGLPEHFYQAELRYDHPSGFYVSVDATSASSYPVDYANTFDTSSYLIWGAKVGYARPNWQVYVDFRNLTDEEYALSVSPFYNDLGTDQARSNPGDGFSVFGGLAFQF